MEEATQDVAVIRAQPRVDVNTCLNNFGLPLLTRVIEKFQAGHDRNGYPLDWVVRMASDADCPPREIPDACNALSKAVVSLLSDDKLAIAEALVSSEFNKLSLGARQIVYSEIGRQALGMIVAANRNKTAERGPDYQADLAKLLSVGAELAMAMEPEK